MTVKFTKEEAIAALKALAAHPAFANGNLAYAIKYVECIGRVPDWLDDFKPDTWSVLHRSEVYEVVAPSEIDAINKVRFRLYGRTPMRDCGAFEAVCPYNIVVAATASTRKEEDRRSVRDLFGRRVVSRQDILKRIKNMTSK